MNAKQAEILFENTLEAIDIASKAFSLIISNPRDITLCIQNKHIISSTVSNGVNMALIYSPESHHMIVYTGEFDFVDNVAKFKGASFI